MIIHTDLFWAEPDDEVEMLPVTMDCESTGMGVGRALSVTQVAAAFNMGARLSRL